jgi:hypothetical protein
VEERAQVESLGLPDHVAIGNQWEDLESLHLEHVNLGLLRRSPVHAPGVFGEILWDSGFRHCQMVLEKGQPSELIAAELDFVIDSKSEDATLFYRDLMEIAEGFLALSRSDAIGIRLETVESNNCRNFHVDRVPLRLVTTYAGLGTEWLSNEDVNREALGSREHERVQKPDSEIWRFESGWVGIMKGETYPGNQGRGFVHRSPTIEGVASSKRILLRMDALITS